MKRMMAAACAGALVFAGAASGAASPTARIAKLEKDLKTLKATVAKQQKTIKTLNNLVSAGFAVDLCILGATTDAFQSTWTAIDQAMATPVFGPQQTISDASACSDLRITRQGIRTPPTVSVFSAIVGLFQGGKAKAFSLFDWLG